MKNFDKDFLLQINQFYYVMKKDLLAEYKADNWLEEKGKKELWLKE